MVGAATAGSEHRSALMLLINKARRQRALTLAKWSSLPKAGISLRKAAVLSRCIRVPKSFACVRISAVAVSAKTSL